MAIASQSMAQTTRVSGRVTDSATGEPLPFVNLFFNTTKEGMVSDFEGFYTLKTTSFADSIIASFIGYHKVILPINIGEIQEVNIVLTPETISLQEIVFMSGENPADRILRNIVKSRSLNDKRSLDYFEYESYNRIELSFDNMSEKMKENKIMADVIKKVDEVKIIRNEKGNRIIPVFISESYSDYFVKNSPETKKEIIKKTRISSVGIEDGSFISQLIGSTYQEYNFYRNWMNILDKEFISPLADGWNLYYDYELVDSVWLGDDYCYHLGVYPKNDEDLAFFGNMWITKNEFALKQIDVSVQKSSNLNFIEALKIQQTLSKTAEGPWLPDKTRVFIDANELSEQSVGMLVKFYNSNSNWKINEVHDAKFYRDYIELKEDFHEPDPEFWNSVRPDIPSEDDKMMFQMVDTLRNIPKIRAYTNILKTFGSGYYRKGKIDYGPVLYAWSINDIEGHRVRLGLRTNEYLNKKFYVRGYGAYGFSDEVFKYGVFGHYIIKRKPWTELTVAKRYDIDQVGLPSDELTENYFFLAATRFGQLNQPYLNDLAAIKLHIHVGKGFSQQLMLRRDAFEPLYNFAYYKNLNPAQGEIVSEYINTSLTYEIRYARDERFMINGNQRVSSGINRAPAIKLRYTYGFKGLLGGDFEYHQVGLDLEKKLKLGLLGVSKFTISAGKVFNPLPYPLLFAHIGNETLFYTTAAFNMMNYFEFVSDEYISLRYQHHFEGFFLNRIPLLRKLKWRLVGNANMVWGNVMPENYEIIPENNQDGEPIESFNSLREKPYIELGYGIENILKVVRLDFFHRITYLDNPNVSPFGVKISFQIIL